MSKRAGWKIYREFVDEGYTGKDTARPAFQEMLDDARRRKFDVLLGRRPDRPPYAIAKKIEILTHGEVTAEEMLLSPEDQERIYDEVAREVGWATSTAAQ